MYPSFEIGDSFTGNYKFCFARTDTLSFVCIPDTITYTVKDVNLSLDTSTRFQNVLFELTFPSGPEFSFAAIGVYDRCTGQGDFQEDLTKNRDIFPGLNNIQVSKDGQTLTVKFSEILNARRLGCYAAELRKNIL